MAKQKPKPFDCILLWKFSRFARSRRDSIVYKTMLRKQLGIDVISVTEQLGDDKLSLLLEAVIEAMDEYYSINLAEEVKRGMLEKVAGGEPVTPPAYGYRIQEKRYIPNSETAPVVRWMFEQRAQGISCKEIAQQLNEMGIPTARGLRWGSSCRRISLQNPVYIGKSVGIRTVLLGVKKHSNHPCSQRETINLLWTSLLWAGSSKINKIVEYGENVSASPKGVILCEALFFVLPVGRHSSKSARNALQCCGYAHGNCTISHYIPNQRLEEWIYCTLDADLSLQNLRWPPSPCESGKPSSFASGTRKKELERLRDAYKLEPKPWRIIVARRHATSTPHHAYRRYETPIVPICGS